MRLLLDTHAFLWWAGKSPELQSEARDAIAEGEYVAVSAAVSWEISIKRSLGKLDAPHDLGEQLGRHRFAPLSISIEHAARAGELPLHHHDPFDRMLVAQAEIERLTIVTRDPSFGAYEVPTLLA